MSTMLCKDHKSCIGKAQHYGLIHCGLMKSSDDVDMGQPVATIDDLSSKVFHDIHLKANSWEQRF